MRRRLVVVVALLVGAAVIGAGWLWLGRDAARPVTIDEARERAGEGSTEPPGTGTSAPGSPIRPAAGVYRYTGSGGERLSLPPLSQDQGPTIPAAVSHLDDGCWSIRFDYSTNHWQSWTYCPQGGDLVETGGRSWQRWMVGTTAITNLTSASCETSVALPAERRPGQVWEARCTATNESVEGEAVSAGPLTFVGEEDLDVGGKTVRAARFLRERTLTGAQTGTERTDLWLAVDTGLPLRNERELRVEADTPIGRSTYTEEAHFELADLDPAS